jgi:hypothetical protein
MPSIGVMRLYIHAMPRQSAEAVEENSPKESISEIAIVVFFIKFISILALVIVFLWACNTQVLSA